MCGFAGIFSAKGDLNQAHVQLTRRMGQVLAHRGPDDDGLYHDAHLAVAHRRLAVIDLSHHGKQPMSNEDGSVWIAYNGEVYNFHELKHRFNLEKNHQFRSATDTEVLVHLYEQLGPSMVEHLSGMFAYAIWDTRRRELHLARDRYGMKPLFYTQHDGRLLFASEIKSILQDESFPRRVNTQAMHDFFSFDYIPGTQTAFENIHEVPPAHRVTISLDGTMKSQRYWDLDYTTDTSIDEATAVKTSLELMDAAVRRHLIADVPVGVLLSGGLDSSAVVALMARHTSESIHTYSIGFDDASFNELPYARIVAKQFNTLHREVVVTPAMVRDMLPRYLRYIDEPYADGSAIPTYYIAQKAAGEVVVVLSGEGGDEAFAGYETHAAYKASTMFQRVPGFIRRGMIAPLVQALPVSDRKLSLEFKLKRFLGGQDLTPQAAHLWWRLVLSEAEKINIYSAHVRETTLLASQRHFDEVFNRSGTADVLNKLLHIDSAVFLPDDLMIKNDRMTMAHSLEARLPFTDPELTEYLARVPAELKMPGLRKKNLMKKALAGLLPQSILTKKKVGLEMPYGRWFRDELRDVLMDYCSPQRVAATGLFDADAVAALIDEHMQRRKDRARALWGMLNFMMWHEMYIG